MNIKYIDLVLENCDVVRLEPEDVLRFSIDGITESIDYYGSYNKNLNISRACHCTYFGILIDKPKEIHQNGFAYPDNTNAYEMITAYSDITAIDIIYEDETNEYIYVDFNEYNDYYNINQKNEYYNNMLEVTITESNSIEEGGIMVKYDTNEKSYDEKDLILGIIYESYSDEIDKEIETIYQKAEAFDEIVNELHYQLQNLEICDTLDQKDCQTLKQILEENIKGDK